MMRESIRKDFCERQQAQERSWWVFSTADLLVMRIWSIEAMLASTEVDPPHGWELRLRLSRMEQANLGQSAREDDWLTSLEGGVGVRVAACRDSAGLGVCGGSLSRKSSPKLRMALCDWLGLGWATERFVGKKRSGVNRFEFAIIISISVDGYSLMSGVNCCQKTGVPSSCNGIGASKIKAS